MLSRDGLLAAKKIITCLFELALIMEDPVVKSLYELL